MRVCLITNLGASLQIQEVGMSKVQFVRTPKGESLAVLPRAKYEALAKVTNYSEHNFGTPQNCASLLDQVTILTRRALRNGRTASRGAVRPAQDRR